jgi:hypothetical protein
VGLAVAEGQKVQKLMISSVTPAVLNKLSGEGLKIISVNAVSKAGLNLIKDSEEQKGYKVGVALLRYSLTPMEIVAVREKLSASQKKGFDVAAAAHIGAATTVKGSSGITAPKTAAAAKAQFAFNATKGMVAATPQLKKEVLAVTIPDQASKAGTLAAVEQVAAGRKAGWWKRLLNKLGLTKSA